MFNKIWCALILAGLLEPLWVYLLMKSNGFSRLGFGVTGILAIALEFGLFTYALKFLPLGLAYSVWVAVGAISVFCLAYLLGENINLMKVFFFSLILVGVIGLKYF